MDEATKRALLESRSLPTIPAVAARILELVRGDCGLADLVPVVSNDPALAARLIRYANSPAYARAEPIATIKPALMQLGLDTTVIVALGFSLVDALRPSSSGTLNYERFWRRALLSAAAARVLANTFGVTRMEEAFLAALLQDIGMMALDRAGIGVYDGLLNRQSDHLMLSVVERGRARTSHPEVGAWLLETWRFPRYIVDAVEKSHALALLSRAPEAPDLNWCVACSGVLADAVLEQDPVALGDALGWAEPFAPDIAASTEAILEPLREALAEIDGLFDVALTTDLMELMNASKELMAERHVDAATRGAR